MRVSEGPFNFRTDCLFCGRMVIRETHRHDDTASEDRFLSSVWSGML